MFLASCSPDETPETSSALGTLDETLQIGANSEDDADAYLFGRISEIATDDAGNIYVADGQAREIRVFDAQGAHINTFGGPGEGPGEFQAITAMMVDSNDRLIVADPLNARISIWAKDGTLQESHTSPVANAVRQISELPNGHFLLVGTYSDHLVHIVDADFRTVLAQLVPVSEALYTENSLEEKMWLPRMPGHAVPLSNDQILYAPAVYGGRLYVYEREDDNTWSRTHTIDAYPTDQRPLTIVENGEDAPFPAPDGRGIQFSSLTSGLLALSDDRAIHVFSRETEDGVTFLAGIVASDGSYEGHLNTEERSYDDHFSLWTYAVDADTNIYQADSHEYPSVRRMSISVEN